MLLFRLIGKFVLRLKDPTPHSFKHFSLCTYSLSTCLDQEPEGLSQTVIGRWPHSVYCTLCTAGPIGSPPRCISKSDSEESFLGRTQLSSPPRMRTNMHPLAINECVFIICLHICDLKFCVKSTYHLDPWGFAQM